MGLNTVDTAKWSRMHSDNKHPMWWGILGLIIVEMTVVAIFLASFFYLWIVNKGPDRMGWPPAGTEFPPLLYPAVNTVLFLVCGWSMWYGGIVMKRNKPMAFFWLVFLCCGCACVALGLRWLQFYELPFSHSANAYASFVWTLTGFHFLHVASAVLGTIAIGWLAYKGYYNDERMLGVQLDTMYWYFVVGVWPFIFFCLYLAPRWL